VPRFDTYGPNDSRYAQDGDVIFNAVNARLRPDQLAPGTLVSSINGRMGLDGAWQTRKGVQAFGGALISVQMGLTLPFYLYANVTISSASRLDDLVTVNTSGAHGFVDQTVVSIDDVTGTVDPEGNHLITVTTSTQFTFLILGATGSETYVLGSAPVAGAPILTEPARAHGYCKFSDPSNESAEYIIVARTDDAVAIAIPSGVNTVIAYPAGLKVTEPCELLQAFDKVFLFRDGLTSWQWNGNLAGTPAFTKVANGNYASTVYLNASSNTVIADGLATVSETAHGLSVGDRVVIIDNGMTLLEEGKEYVVATVPGANSFTFYAEVADASATVVVYSTKLSKGRGFTHMPAPPWATYHQRRLWMPFRYTTTGTSGSEVITSRDIRDEIIASDILDANTYDQLQNQFRVTAGIADYLVALHPFTDDNMLTMNRNSLHLVSGLSGELEDITIKLITSEAGVVARKSVVQIANSIFFLSDNGIYAANFGDLYNLRGAGLPLSDPIQPIIDRINRDFAHNAVGVFHDNRYWLAVPLDGSEVNNAILVYNLLNQSWESVDQINEEGWNAIGFILAGSGSVNKLYVVSTGGGIHVIDERADDQDLIALRAGEAADSVPISSEMTTRSYTMGSVARKSFTRFELHVESSHNDSSDATIYGSTENLDTEFTVGTFGSLLQGAGLDAGEDASIRGRIGKKRAFSLGLRIVPTFGRPKVRAVQVDGSLTFQSTKPAT